MVAAPQQTPPSSSQASITWHPSSWGAWPVTQYAAGPLDSVAVGQPGGIVGICGSDTSSGARAPAATRLGTVAIATLIRRAPHLRLASEALEWRESSTHVTL